jgi:hypothetical protein
MIEGTTLQLDSIPRERLQPKQVVEHRAHTFRKGEESAKEIWTPCTTRKYCFTCCSASRSGTWEPVDRQTSRIVR